MKKKFIIESSIILAYLLVSGIHLSTVWGSTWLLILLILFFEVVRLLAILTKLPKAVILFSGASVIFITFNYYSYFSYVSQRQEKESYKERIRVNAAEDLLKYSQGTLLKAKSKLDLVEKMENLIDKQDEKLTFSLPNPSIVFLLLLITEFGFAYILWNYYSVPRKEKVFSGLREIFKPKKSEELWNRGVREGKIYSLNEKFYTSEEDLGEAYGNK
jgi:ABC-type multidrug transport system fused ATPase/permease subunit